MVGPKFPLSLVLTAVDRITGPLTRINNRIGRITAPLRSVGNAVSSLGSVAGVSRVVDGFRSVASAAGDMATAVGTSFKRLGVLTVAGGGLAFLFKRQFIDTASSFQNLQISLEGIEGSAERARASMAFIKDLTVKTPFELKEIADTFRLMRAQGMDPMDGSLQAIINQVAKVGGSGDKLVGIAMQLSQAWSKGRLMAQDANILAENGIPVWAMLARAVERTTKGQKLSVAQLRKMSENGQLGLKAITLLIEQMGLESQGASNRMMKTWTGMVSNLSDQWSFFKLRVMESGPFAKLGVYLQRILDRIDVMARNGELERWADRFATTLLEIFTWLDTNGPRILNQIWTNATRVWAIADKVATAFGGWGNFITFGIAAYIGGPMVTSVFSLVGAILSLNAALLGTPAGWLLTGAGLALLGGVVAYKSFHWPELPAGPKSILPGAVDRNGVPLIDARGVPPGVPPAPRGVPPGVPPAPSGPAGFGIPRGPAVGATPPPMGLTLSAEEQAAFRASVAANGAARDARVKVDVDFKNVPPGTTIRTTQSGDLPIDFSRGVAMAHAH